MTVHYLREARIEYGPRKRNARVITDHLALRAFLLEEIGSLVSERIVAVSLDSRQRPLAWTIVASGTELGCPLQLSVVLRFALMAGGPSFILAHNHPSGSAEPSPQDDVITEKLCQAAKLVGLVLLDHVVVTDTEVFSYQQAGRMPQ